MGSTMKQWLLAMAMATLAIATGCKSNGSYEAREKTTGEEVEAMDEHGDTAIDDADKADDSQLPSPGTEGE